MSKPKYTSKMKRKQTEIDTTCTQQLFLIEQTTYAVRTVQSYD
jgi:hypothetical protein